MLDDQSQAIDFLSRGASFGLPDATPRRIDTHISIVFLVGDRVFKMKRALKLSFIDYSTLAERERFCRAEFELNRRTAPETLSRCAPADAGTGRWDRMGR